MPSVQPENMTNSTGVVLSIGIVCNGDRGSIVIPICTDAPDFDPITACKDAVDSFFASCLTQLLDCISSDAYVSFIAAEGMQDGRVPYRSDFSSTASPGTGHPNALPSQVAAMLAFYCDPDDLATEDVMRVGKTSIFGISADDVVGDIVQSGEVGKLSTFGFLLLIGYGSVLYGGFNWYRVLAAPKPRTADHSVKRCAALAVRDYVVTQRRRLIPH